ncbi:helix-turn-helix domain-containing protein [Frankia canadensis]|nr:helix-turn-helix domain-containing protein [Frankia canadensis]
MTSTTSSGVPAGATPPVSPLASPHLAPPGARPAVSGSVGAVGGPAVLGPAGFAPPGQAAGATSGVNGGAGPTVAGPASPATAAARPSDDDEVLTVEELVAWLRLSESTVLKLLSERAIPARKVGHQWRVRRGRVRDWLDGRE